ncbi:inorganic phosphate transporter [Paracoccus methylarcula]|uniref:Phosphate transporter n=1 Tax=Paracoccus methylarcula TaxID=72022 RepID=A0A422QTC9_9RHOB|nr:inorganic phosphate transporter [Paracoccus methylarcula]RNF33031.1 inorganic phosphate transporter [Paracoccus methylarcula]
MRLGKRGFHVLDKDLGRITHVETAQIHAFRPVLRLGLAILLCVAVLILSMGMMGRDPGFVGVGAGLIVACWLGLAIGSNDVANSLGPAVGAGAIGLLPGLALVALAEIAGASLAGGAVTHRLAGGIFDAGFIASAGQEQMLMLAALIGAASWITLASGAGLPVSTSHSIVGAIAGASMAALGAGAVHWNSLLTIASAWIISPLFAGALAAVILAFVTVYVREAPDRAAAAQRWLPVLIGAMAGLFLAYLALLVARRLDIWPLPPVLLALLTGFPVGWMIRRRLEAEFSGGRERPRMKHLFRPPLLASVVIMAFAHGANDVGNVAGPLSVFLPLAGTGTGTGLQVPLLVLLMAGLAIALGTLLFGRRLVAMVGTGITRLNPVRAFCVSLATAATVLGASGAGLPVSTTHVAVGGIFGVGFIREWLDRRRNRNREALPAEETRRRLLIRRSHVATITAAWVVTVPMTAVLGAVGYLLIRLATGI